MNKSYQLYFYTDYIIKTPLSQFPVTNHNNVFFKVLSNLVAAPDSTSKY